MLGGFDSANYRTELLWAPARDGARVPVSLVYRKSTKLDGSAPLLQEGYGAYGYSSDPDFAVSRLSLLDRGFVYALAHIRGGQEMGRHYYRALVANVPFVDVVTSMLDESIPLTTNEFDEWGDPKDKMYYDYMLSYSPYDNVTGRDYPAMLVTTALWDSQVQYYEPAKWVARLRARKTDDNPLLFRTSTDAEHTGKSGRFESYRKTAEEYAFILDQLGVTQ